MAEDGPRGTNGGCVRSATDGIANELFPASGGVTGRSAKSGEDEAGPSFDAWTSMMAALETRRELWAELMGVGVAVGRAAAAAAACAVRVRFWTIDG